MTNLGKKVGGDQVRPVQAKVEAILAVPFPPLGTSLWWVTTGVFVRIFPLAAPLTDLFSPKVGFCWSTLCQSAFKKLNPYLSVPRVVCAVL